MEKKAADQGLPSLAIVFGYIAVKDLQRLEDRVALLARLGYGNKGIAAICGTTVDSVATLKARSKRSGSKKKRATPVKKGTGTKHGK